MKTRYLFSCIVILLSGCASFQVGTDVEAGRKAFLIGNNAAALGYFEKAAELDPNYVYGTAPKDGTVIALIQRGMLLAKWTKTTQPQGNRV